MTPTPNDIEGSLNVPDQIADPMLAAKDQQDADRGDWPSPRDHRQPEPPWPAEDNPVLRYLLWTAKASVAAGMDPEVAMLQLAVHTWFEGGIAGHDGGQRDARRLRSV